MKKRIALAAVAALAGGLLVAAPASATIAMPVGPFAVDGTGIVTSDTTTVSSTAGAYDSVSFKQVASTAGYAQINGVRNAGNSYTSVTVTGGTLTASTETCQSAVSGSYYTASSSTVYVAPSTTVGICNAGDTATSSTFVAGHITVPTTAAGTITVSVYGNSFSGGVSTSTLLQVYTITVVAAASATSYNHTTVASLAAGTGAAYFDANGVGYTPNALNNSETFTVNQYSSADNSVALGTSALTQAVTVSLSGVGSLSDGTTNGVTYLAYSAGTLAAPVAALHTITVKSDGRSGVATVTVSVNGTAAATRTVTFYGDIASIAVTQSNYVLNNGSTSAQTVGTLMAKDASGVEVPLNGTSVTATSSNTAVLTTASFSAANTGLSDSNTVTVTAAPAAGGISGATATVTYSVVNTAGTTISAAPVTVALGGAIATETAAFDTATYAPGTKATLVIMAKDSKGNAAYDGQTPDVSATWSSNLSAQGVPSTTAGVTLSNGAAKVALYAPAASGTWTVSFSANDGLTTHASVSASAAVVAPATATDTAVAANAAALATLQTAVASLSTTVASLVASMTAQIKVINASLRTLSKAIARIKAKLGIK